MLFSYVPIKTLPYMIFQKRETAHFLLGTDKVLLRSHTKLHIAAKAFSKHVLLTYAFHSDTGDHTSPRTRISR